MRRELEQEIYFDFVEEGFYEVLGLRSEALTLELNLKKELNTKQYMLFHKMMYAIIKAHYTECLCLIDFVLKKYAKKYAENKIKFKKTVLCNA